MSESTKKIIITTLVLGGFFVISGALYYFTNKKAMAPTETKNQSNNNSIQKEEALPKPTGKVDDAISAAVAEIESEEKLLEDEKFSAESAIDESSEVSSFGQTYDENEL